MKILDCHFELKLGQNRIKADFESSAQVTGLFGASGSGKTSILHAIAGLIRPDSGSIRIEEQTWFDQNERRYVSTQRRRVGLVFQEANLFPHMSVWNNLLFGYQHIEAKERQFQPEQIIELLKLEKMLKRQPNRLSGGEKQRVALGRALLYSPRLLLLDEPLSALDAAHKTQILPFFKTVKQELGIPMLYVSHDLSEIHQLTDTIWHI